VAELAEPGWIADHQRIGAGMGAAMAAASSVLETYVVGTHALPEDLCAIDELRAGDGDRDGASVNPRAWTVVITGWDSRL